MDSEVLELAGPDTPPPHALLACIVCTCSELDQKYGHIREAKDFLTRVGEPLETELKDVWERKSFRRIRLIVQLRSKNPIPMGLSVLQDDSLV